MNIFLYVTFILDFWSKLYNMIYKLTLAYMREQMNHLIASKAKKSLDVLFVEYSIMKGNNILKSIPNAQAPFEVGVKKKGRNEWREKMEEKPNTYPPSERSS